MMNEQNKSNCRFQFFLFRLWCVLILFFKVIRQRLTAINHIGNLQRRFTAHDGASWFDYLVRRLLWFPNYRSYVGIVVIYRFLLKISFYDSCEKYQLAHLFRLIIAPATSHPITVNKLCRYGSFLWWFGLRSTNSQQLMVNYYYVVTATSIFWCYSLLCNFIYFYIFSINILVSAIRKLYYFFHLISRFFSLSIGNFLLYHQTHFPYLFSKRQPPSLQLRTASHRVPPRRLRLP